CVSLQFSSFRIYPLTWKLIFYCTFLSYTIKIICPEESLVLVASTPQEKNKWLRSLNQAVDLVLGGAAQGSSPGVTAAVCRTASYKFVSDERFKDAQYSGQWKEGKIHGFGKYKSVQRFMETFLFKQNQRNVAPLCVLRVALRYGSGEVYDGCFCDGRRHGYGMLSSGKLAGASSGLFIGQWVQDKKTGYGVHDDITRGEKFMGFWLDDQRHSSAVVLTQYGVYFEGSFKENKMSGSGLLVSDDDTVFHGEFSDDWTINGKGVLTLANGDRLDGLFSGEWSAGLKVVGTYVKPAMDDNKEKDEPPLHTEEVAQRNEINVDVILNRVLFYFSFSVLVVSCSSLLLPLLLPRLYPPLFTLYCLQQEPEEAQYWERILRLNKQPDQALLGFLGVQESVSCSARSTTFTPSDKLLVIQKTFEELTLEVKPFLAGDFLWCMDDLFPLFLYVVLRARVRNLGAEVSLIEDLMDPNLQHGEMGLMFTTLKVRKSNNHQNTDHTGA
uniref:Alsin Rho guanine nucleotide exchange factor ALS2 a n=1 Tax=Xiphophorus couchianus TaxID=32473 RepID=A0A3B5M6L8_9TELE